MDLSHPKTELAVRRRYSWAGAGVSQPPLREDARGTVAGSAREKRPWQESSNAPGKEHVAFASQMDGATSQSGPLDSRADPVSYRQLLRLGRELDEALAGRTSLLNELEMLRSSQSWLKTSLDQLDAGLATMGPSDFKETDKSPIVNTLSPTEHHTPSAEPSGMQATNYMPQLESPLLSDAPPTLQPGGNATRSAPSIEILVQNVRQDLKRHREQEQTFSATLQSLSSKEYHINVMQRALAKDLRSPGRATEVAEGIISRNETLLPAVPESPRPASEVPSIVQQYFDRVGDIGVWLERLDELREAWDEGLAERELLADRGDELEVTDDEYNATYQEREAYIEREVAEAQEEADHLKSLCLAENHNIDQYKTRRQSLTSFGSSEPLPTSLFPVLDFPLESVDPQVSSTIDRQPAKRISSWLQSVDASGTDALPDAPEEPATELSGDPSVFPFLAEKTPSPGPDSTTAVPISISGTADCCTRAITTSSCDT